MKQSPNSHNFVSKEELFDTLKYYPTKEELKAAEEKLRGFYMQALGKSNHDIDKKFVDRMVASQAASKAESDHNFIIMQERLDRRFDAFASRVLTAIDPLIKEVETRQQERELAAAQMKHTQDDITDLQKRVTKLEHS